MPIIELDMLTALVNREDKHHEIAVKFFEEIARGRIRNIAVAASALIEYELILKSRGYKEEEIAADIEAFINIENMREAPLTSKTMLTAINLRKKYGLTYFDSLHAAAAILYDETIISADKAYKTLKELKAIDPEELKTSQ